MKSDNPGTPIPETTFPASVSIADLLKAGQLVKPSNKNKVTLTFEKFDVHKQEWQEFMEQNIFVETEKFSSVHLEMHLKQPATLGGTNVQRGGKDIHP